jgi:hypothetical protein
MYSAHFSPSLQSGYLEYSVGKLEFIQRVQRSIVL